MTGDSRHLFLLNEIAQTIGEAESLQDALHGVVRPIAREMHVDVCSIYLLDAAGKALTLAATQGLSSEAVGRARLERGQGLTWQVLIRGEPVLREDAHKDPHFVYIPVTHEDDFHSYMGLPLVVRGDPIGVICVQTREARRYSADELRALSAIASQVAPVVDNARLMSLMDETPATPPKPRPQTGPRRVMGTPCSNGIVTGKIALLDAGPLPTPPPVGSRDEELARLARACRTARDELQRMQAWLRSRDAEEAALVFTVQLMLLEDPSYEGRMRKAVESGHSAHEAIREVTETVLTRFGGLDSVYFKERAQDVQDLGGRLLRHVAPQRPEAADSLRGKIVVLPRLTPSRMVSLCAEGVGAILTGGGGATSHAALLARSLDLPLIVGLRDFVNEVRDGQNALVDAASGEVVLDPLDTMIEEATQAAQAGVEALHRLEGKGSGRIRFEANVSLFGDALRAKRNDADGVGLYRTEFAFLMRPDLPGEEEQKVLYRRIVEAVAPKPVTFRLLDAGGDKLVPALATAREPNPFLGYRSLRILIDHPEILRGQARAIAFALQGTPGRLLLPMVGSIEEYRTVRTILEEECAPLPPIGAMIEVPSALFELDELAAEADFLCVGTNDLMQYLLGVDRTNARVMRFYDPCHPALVRSLHLIAQAARRAGKSLGICGEMASNPLFLPVWLGLGVERLVVHATRLGVLRGLEARLDVEEARAATSELIKLATASEVRARLEELAPPEVLTFVRVRGGR